MKYHNSLSLVSIDSINVNVASTKSEFIDFINSVSNRYPNAFKIEPIKYKTTYTITKDSYVFESDSVSIRLNIFSSLTQKYTTPKIKFKAPYVSIEFAGLFDYNIMPLKEVYLFLKLLNQTFQVNIKRLDLNYDFRVSAYGDITFSADTSKFKQLVPNHNLTSYYRESESLKCLAYDKSLKSCYPALNQDKTIVRLEFSLRDTLKNGFKSVQIKHNRLIDDESLDWLKNYLQKQKFFYFYDYQSFNLPIDVMIDYLRVVFDYIQFDQEEFELPYRSHIEKIVSVTQKRDTVFKFLDSINLTSYRYKSKLDENISYESLDKTSLLRALRNNLGTDEIEKNLFNRILFLYLNDKERTKKIIESKKEASQKVNVVKDVQQHNFSLYYATYSIGNKIKTHQTLKLVPGFESRIKEAIGNNIQQEYLKENLTNLFYTMKLPLIRISSESNKRVKFYYGTKG